MKVTIAICTWNRADLLDKTLERMRKLVIPEGVEWEILVVDNNSTDDTQRVIARHASALPIRAFLEQNQGQSYARNHAIREANGEILLWTDDDVLVDPDWLRTSVDAMQQTSAGVGYGRVLPWWESSPPTWFDDCLSGRFALFDRGPGVAAVTSEEQIGYGANHAVRRYVYDAIGCYREDLGFSGTKGGGDDTEFFVRAFRAGVPAIYMGESQVDHFIPKHRCRRGYFRRRTWVGAGHQITLLNQLSPDAPRVLGIPRYAYRNAIESTLGYVTSLVRRKRGEAFNNELKIINMVGMLASQILRKKSS